MSQLKSLSLCSATLNEHQSWQRECSGAVLWFSRGCICITPRGSSLKKCQMLLGGNQIFGSGCVPASFYSDPVRSTLRPPSLQQSHKYHLFFGPYRPCSSLILLRPVINRLNVLKCQKYKLIDTYSYYCSSLTDCQFGLVTRSDIRLLNQCFFCLIADNVW